MTDQTLYSALNTIAQCAAALAALIGFLGLWRLDRLREEEQRIGPQLRELMSQSPRFAGQVQSAPGDRRDLARVPRWELDRAIDQVIADPKPGLEEQIKPELEAVRQRGRDLPRVQLLLLCALRGFLLVTLLVLGGAVGGFLLVDHAKAWVGTPWLLGGAGVWLVVGPTWVVFTAARLPRAPVALALLLLLASPALAGPVQHCTTYEEKSLGRWQTLCDDGTRAVSTYNRTLERWDTTVTPPPGQTCEGRLNPKTRQVEMRCR